MTGGERWRGREKRSEGKASEIEIQGKREEREQRERWRLREKRRGGDIEEGG